MASTSSQYTLPVGWVPEPIPPAGYLSRKALPIKRQDAEPLTRVDVQYDLLDYIFSDEKKVFTSQIPGNSSTKVTFSDLYVKALYHSSKCSKVLKDKMIETPAFGIELAKISLLTNVGRINTTMAFFPEMKTALRTYHPVPSLQKTDGNAQDAPRIKNCLKAALLSSEQKTVPPSTPEEILTKSRAGQIPPTSVVNLIFVLANHAGPLASVHFEPFLNFLDIFLTKPLASADRAQAFLWLIFHYLEDPNAENPFHDEFSRNHPDKAPYIRRLTEAEFEKENVDTQEEIEWGKKMSRERNAFLQKLVTATENARNPPPTVPSTSDASSRRPRQQQHQVIQEELRDGPPFRYYVPESRESSAPAPAPGYRVGDRGLYPATSQPQRTMLQQAWYTAMTTDPLADSDEEADEHTRLDYTRRLNVLTRVLERFPVSDDRSTEWPGPDY